jgi:hypothetical protein
MPEYPTAELLAWASRQVSAQSDRQTRFVGGSTPAMKRALEEAIAAGVRDAAAAIMPDAPHRQQAFLAVILGESPAQWPMVDGTHPADLVLRLRSWTNLLTAVDTRPVSERESRPALAVICAAILARVELASGNGTVGSIWTAFLMETGIRTVKPEIPAAAESAPTFQLDNASAHNLIQGQRVEVHMQTAPSPAPAARTRPHSFRKGSLLIGRIPTLAAARQERAADRALPETPASAADVKVCHVLTGMAGAGKTQVAAAYARKRWDSGELGLLVWVSADSRESITATFAEAASRVCEADPSDPERAAAEFLDWLDRPTGPRWLVVLDGLSDPNHLNLLWPPESSHGSTVITTRVRRTSWHGARRAVLEIRSFVEAESAAFFSQWFGAESPQLRGADSLAERLGHLPSALVQAATFIHSQPDLTCERYLEMLSDGSVDPGNLCPGMVLDDYPEPVAESIEWSIDVAAGHRPQGLALSLLERASLLDAEGFPTDLLRSETVLGTSFTVPQANNALRLLHQESLIDIEGGMVRVHPMTQWVVRLGIEPEDRDRHALVLADALLAIWPDPENDFERMAMLRANVLCLKQHASNALVDGHARPLLFKTGDSFVEWGRYEDAAELFLRLRDRCAQRLGFEHPDTMKARGRYAWHGITAVHAKVRTLEALLDDQVQVLGWDHEDTLRTQDYLAGLLGEVRTSTDAVIAHEELLKASERALGERHRFTLETRRWVAYWKRLAGNREEAVAEAEAVLRDQTSELGPHDPDTLATRSLLLNLFKEEAEPEAIVAEHEALLSDLKLVKGPLHPSTLEIHSNFTYWLIQAGKLAEAEVEAEVALAGRIKVFGPKSTRAFLTRNNLEHARSHRRDKKATIRAFQALLTDAEIALGSEHPRVSLIRQNLESWSLPAGMRRPRLEPGADSGRPGDKARTVAWRRLVNSAGARSKTGELWSSFRRTRRGRPGASAAVAYW